MSAMDANFRDETADVTSSRLFGGATFAAFDARDPADRAAAATLCDRLIGAGFTPNTAAALFGHDEMIDIRPSRTRYYDAFVLPQSDAGSAARFFVLHEPQTDATLRAWLGDASVDFLERMHAIVAVDGKRRSLISISWFAGRLIAADARAYNAVWPCEPQRDYVMPPGRDSLGLLHVAPRTRRAATLDLCCGPGTQTLAAAAYSDRVVGVDINPRAIRFAEVNAAANRIEHATFVLGDLYEPLDDARFDAILANPPFVPWPDDADQLYFRGGGATGDDVIARILAGAVTSLEPDGALSLVADVADSATLIDRIRTWQHQPRRTLVLLEHRHELIEYAERHTAHYAAGAERDAMFSRLLTHLQSAAVGSLDYGYILQQAAPGDAHLFHTQAARSNDITADVAAWFAHQAQLMTSADNDRLLDLATGVHLVDVGERDASGAMAQDCFLAPGPASLHEPVPVSRAAYALLSQAITGELRFGNVVNAPVCREIAPLLDRGLLRLRGL